MICAPVLPGITDSPAALDELVRATKEAGGHYIYANPLFLKPCSAKVFLPFLEQEFPHLVAEYRKRFEDRAFLGKAYAKRISELMARLRKKHGITREVAQRGEISPSRAVEDEQLSLFHRQLEIRNPKDTVTTTAGAKRGPQFRHRFWVGLEDKEPPKTPSLLSPHVRPVTDNGTRDWLA